MEFINRDNLRHLTGLGREYAAFLDHVANQWDEVWRDPMPTGNLMVWKDQQTGEFCAKFVPNPDWGNDPLMLSIFVTRDGCSEIIALPILMVMAQARDYSRTYQLYQHDFLTDKDGVGISNAVYIGITKRGWRTRWMEHLRSAENGSHYRFHRAIRQWHGSAKISMHTVVACGLSEREALTLEESLVERDSLYPRGLNMVPGGNAGLAYLRSIGAIGTNERVLPDDRQDAINRFFERATRKGLPNPLAAANWLNPEYAEKVICAGPDRLKPQQIRDARYFASLGQDAGAIASRVGARNVAQVERLLSGNTYSRVL